ncbi:MAG: autotransporter-associated beta strand repeat-containing protein [Luteolibacter sp.]
MKPLRLVSLLLLGSAASYAANLTWDSNSVTDGSQDGSGTWDTTTPNWNNGSGSVAFTSGDNVTIGAASASTAAYTVTLATSTSAGTITWANTGAFPRYTIDLGGNTLTATGQISFNAQSSSYSTAFSNGTVALRKTGSTQASPDIFFDPNDGTDWGVVVTATTDVGTGSRYVRGTPQRNDLARYSGDLRFDGPITGSANLFFSGTGVDSSHNVHYVLNAANTGFTGGVTLNGNTDLALTKATALSSANNVTFDAGSVRASLFLFGQSVTIGNLFDTGAGTRWIRNGSLSATSGGTGTSVSASNGVVSLGVNADSVLTITQTTAATFGGIISDGGNDNALGATGTYRTLGIIKDGAAALTLSSANTFTGDAVVRAGSLVLTNSAALGGANLANTTAGSAIFDSSVTSHAFTLGGLKDAASPATPAGVVLQDSAATAIVLTIGGNNATVSFTGGVTGPGSLTKTGTGIQTLGGTNTYSGGTTIANGGLGFTTGLGTGAITVNAPTGTTFLTAATTAAVSLPNNITLASPAAAATYTLVKNTSGQTTGTQFELAGVISGGNANHTLLLNTNTSGDNSSTFRFAGVNTFRSTINMNRGGVIVANTSSLGDPANQIIINSNGNTTLGDLRFELGMTLPNPVQFAIQSPVSTGANDVEFSGVLSGVGGLTKLGTGKLTLSGTGGYSGATTISVGTLQVGTGGVNAPFGAGNVTNNGALVFNTTTDITSAGTVAGTGSITKNGSNAVTFNGAMTLSGGLDLNAGTLNAAGGWTGGGALNLAAGTFKFGSSGSPVGTVSAASLNQTGATLSMDISGATGDTINLTGDYTAASGGITVNVLAAPTTGVPYTLVNYGGTLSAHPSITVNGLGGSRLGYEIDYGSGTAGAITITFVGISGNLTWTGQGGSAWDLTTAHWYNGFSFDTYFQQDNVTFDDQANPGTDQVTLNFAATPGIVTFANNDFHYVLSGTGSISGGAILVKTGTGTAVLATNNDYTGTTSVNGGTLQIGDGGTSGTLGSGAVSVLTNLSFKRSDTLLFGNTVTGAGTISQDGTGTLVITGGFQQAGDVTVSAGTLQIGNGGTTGSIATANIVNNGALVINRSDALTFANAISGSGSLTKIGTTTLTLTGTNTYSGGTYLSGGAISVADGSRLGTGTIHETAPSNLNVTSASAATVANNLELGTTTGTYRLVKTSTSTSGGTPLAMTGTISGGGAGVILLFDVSLINDNTTSVVLSGSNTFTGQMTMNRGVLEIAGPNALGNPANLLLHDTYNNATLGDLRFSGGSYTVANPISLSFADHTLLVDGTDAINLTGTVSQNGTTARALNKIGTGKLTLSNAANTYTGATVIKAGTLAVDGTLSTATGTVTAQVGTVLTGSGTINRPVSVSGTLAPGEGVGTLTVGNTTTFAAGSTYSLQIGDWTGLAGAGYDQLASNAVAITATSASKFTVNVDASAMANFTDGSKTFVIATGTQTGLVADNWTVTTTGFSGAGTWKLQVNGSQLELVYSLGTPYDNWASSFGSLPSDKRGPLDDYDNDGVPNLLEYVLGGNPTIADGGSTAPASHQAGGNLIFNYTRSNDSKTDTTQVVQYGSSLSGWTDIPIGATGGGMVAITPNGNGTETVTVTIPMDGNAKLFARLKVTKSGS